MPVSRFRVCPKCSRELPTPEAFRDSGRRFGEKGRPPIVCRDCRAKDPVQQERQARNVAARTAANARDARYAARTEAELIADRDRTHPSGRKTCPALSGCGRSLPFSAFGRMVHHQDGLQGRCQDCQAAAAALHDVA